MNFSTFRQDATDTLTEPMFMGNSVNVARYDQQSHPIFENIIEKQLSFFWRPEEVDVSKDRADWQSLTDCEKHIFISNLKYQTLLDSVAARSVNVCLASVGFTSRIRNMDRNLGLCRDYPFAFVYAHYSQPLC